MDKQSAILYPCLQVLNSKLELFFSYLSDMQFNAALTLLQMAPKQPGGEFLQKHSKVWEELIHPFKLLIDCERQYYEWGFLQYLPAYNDGGCHLSLILSTNSSFFSSSSTATGKSSSKEEKKQKHTDEGTLKYMYHQIPLGLKKTMAQLQKFVGSYHQQQQQQHPLPQPILINPNYQNSHLNYQQQTQHSSPTHQSQHYNAASAYNSPTQLPPAPKLASSQSSMNFNTAAILPPSSPDIPRFLSLLHLMDELIGGYIMLKITMIQLYQNLNAPYSSISRIKEMNWTELQRVCEKLRFKCEKAFVHPYLLELKQKILDPELFLLEQVGMIESDAAPMTMPLSPQPTPSPTHHTLGGAAAAAATQPQSPTSPSATPVSQASPYGSAIGAGGSSGGGGGSAGGFLPSYNWKHCMFVLLRIKAEQTKWMNRIIARDREINGTSASVAAGQTTTSAALTAGGGNVAGAGTAGGLNQASLARKSTTGLSTLLTGSGGTTATVAATSAGALKYSLLSNPTQTAIFPSILYWIHQLHHSLFCKSTLLFHNILSRTCGEIRGEDFMSKINEKVEVNYVSLFEKLMKKLAPNCYSVSIVMDCSGMDHIVSAETPLVLHDAAVLREGQLASSYGQSGQQDSASPACVDTADVMEEKPSGGLSSYPVLFHWPPNKPLLEKWNLVSTLISKQDLMDSMHSYTASQTTHQQTSGKHSSSTSGSATSGTQLPIPKQTNSYILAIGPSNHPSDLMIWDFESEFLASQQAAQQANQPPPPTVSYFICKLDVQKNVYIVITFQNSVSSAHEEGMTTSAGSNAASGATNVSSPLPTVGSYTGGVHGPSPATPMFSSTASASASIGPSASPSSNVNTSAFLPAAARKRVFDLLLQEVVPILHKLRHMHVFQQMQPSLGKRKN